MPMHRGAGRRSAGSDSQLPRNQVTCAFTPYRAAGRGPNLKGRVGSRGGSGWPRPAKGGPAGPGAHLAVDNDRPLGSQAQASGGSWGSRPPGDGLSKSSVRRGLGLSSPEATSNHHQDPEGDTTLTRPWPVVHARGGLRAKAGLSLHRVSAVMKRLSKIGGTSPAPEDH